ncbi:hypothetical protein JVT61DRAFT_10710 [Boletus reticuloceps]|uniref:Uncharacterized protein n=1 Tax=Boletus reticuloceps TaxID=495285 RepID=A0A8I2YFI3_9AGAM|nr:hypothetical protein JVT61DRAFT_10710 [Boletus reticuloceps]
MAFSETNPCLVYRCLSLSPDERLPGDIVSFIHGSDSLFFRTYDAGEDGEQSMSHVGMNYRGGRPGFVRIRPSDGRTLVIPDYSIMLTTSDALD